MKKHTLFTSDAHLSPTEPETVKLFLNFLNSIDPQTDALYILGDLFKFWVGDDDRSEFNEAIKQALKKLSTKIPIYLMPGNRDFTLGQIFATESGCILLPDPCVINLYGAQTILTHGDILCTKDKIHCVFRKIIRMPFGINIFLKLPIKFRIWLASKIQSYSAKAKLKKSKISMLVQSDAVQKLLTQYDATKLIHGHTHYLEITKNRIALAEWGNVKINALIYNANGDICAIKNHTKY
jgi:UDP-2,3-diacylglucosamine hydrolase